MAKVMVYPSDAPAYCIASNETVGFLQDFLKVFSLLREGRGDNVNWHTHKDALTGELRIARDCFTLSNDDVDHTEVYQIEY